MADNLYDSAESGLVDILYYESAEHLQDGRATRSA